MLILKSIFFPLTTVIVVTVVVIGQYHPLNYRILSCWCVKTSYTIFWGHEHPQIHPVLMWKPRLPGFWPMPKKASKVIITLWSCHGQEMDYIPILGQGLLLTFTIFSHHGFKCTDPTTRVWGCVIMDLWVHARVESRDGLYTNIGAGSSILFQRVVYTHYKESDGVRWMTMNHTSWPWLP